jgi:deazaflavin-dependent oxidoreductase (nitroreductase family)
MDIDVPHTAPRTATPAARPPLQVRLLSPILKMLVAAGVPLGYNGLITIRGRKSGRPRTAAVAILPSSGRRWVWAPWGDVHWVLNLRAARRATITLRRRAEDVTAIELDEQQRVEFFRDVLGPFARRIPFGTWFIRVVDGVDLNDPEGAARGRRVFELRPVH